jgi:hypothetical protein
METPHDFRSTSHLGPACEVLNVNWQTLDPEQGSATEGMDLEGGGMRPGRDLVEFVENEIWTMMARRS